MPNTVYEFPLNEKVRTYLRLEQLFKQLHASKKCVEDWQFINFFDCYFTLLDLLERIDMRTDILKDIEAHEKNLTLWAEHPKIDKEALDHALAKIVELKGKLKSSQKVGTGLKGERFLLSIKQRFSIPGATCSFDLPNLHYWLKQSEKVIHADMDRWISEFALIQQAIEITLSFLRERGRFEPISAPKGFYQGVADEKIDLILIHCHTELNYYPTLSGNKYRYAIRFMVFDTEEAGQSSVEEAVEFKLACC
ncbi:MAG: cell division protein ZapD [Aestuariibacter sp.]